MKRYTKMLIVLLGVFVVGQILVLLTEPTQRGKVTKQKTNDLKRPKTSPRSISKMSQNVSSSRISKGERVDLPNSLVHKDSFNVTRHQLFEKQYPNFNITAPLFIDEKSRVLFYRHQSNIDTLGIQPKNKLHGEIFEVKGGTLDVRNDCGYRSNRTLVHPNRNVTKNRWYPALMPVVVPEAQTVQHFIDGALPKIIQALPLLQNRSVKLLIEKVRDTIVLEMLIKLNVAGSQIVFFRVNPMRKHELSEYAYGADRLIYSCIAPPLHPTLWREARAGLGVPTLLQVPPKDGFIVFVTRGGCYNCGRTVFNKPRVFKMLKQRYDEERVKVFDGPISLKENIELFGNARIIMGPHGGGMYNINFAPSKTAIIEFMATHDNGDMVAASDKIIWTMAQMLDQEYWRLSLRPIGRKGQMDVDVGKLEHILDVLDKRIGL